MEEGERITALINVTDFEQGKYFIMASRRGEIKKTPLKSFANIRGNGIIAFKLKTGDDLVSVALSTDDDEYIIVTENGQALRSKVEALRSASRYSGGVRGIKLLSGDKAIAMDIVSPENHLLTISINGHGKLTPLRSYPTHSRGGQGVRTFRVDSKTGQLVSARVVNRRQELMVISTQGTVFRTNLNEISVQGRITRGVSIVRPDAGDVVAAIACFDRHTDEPSNSKPKEKAKG